MSNHHSDHLAEKIYTQVKTWILNFELQPGEYFSENRLAKYFQASRTPVREALQQLARESYVQVHFRSGWQVMPLDFEVFDELYELRTLVEVSAAQKLCQTDCLPDAFKALEAFWSNPEVEQPEQQELSRQDRSFHLSLVEMAGNREMLKVHQQVSDRIHIIRRLDYSTQHRVTATYLEHAAVLEAIRLSKADRVEQLLKQHIGASQQAVQQITLHKLDLARKSSSSVLS